MEKKVEIFTVQFGNKDLYPEDEHKQAEEVEAILVEGSVLNEGVGLMTWFLTLVPVIGPILGGMYSGGQIKKVIKRTLDTSGSFRAKGEELRELKAKRKKTDEDKSRIKFLTKSIADEIKKGIKNKQVVMSESVEETEIPLTETEATLIEGFEEEMMLNEGVGLMTWFLTLVPVVGPILGGMYSSGQIKKVIKRTLDTSSSFRAKGEELRELKSKRKKTDQEKSRIKFLTKSIADEIKKGIKNKQVVMSESVEEMPKLEGLEYKEKFEALLKHFGAKKISDLSDEDKKEFFNTLDEVHTSEEESGELKNVEVGDSQVKIELDGELNSELSDKEEEIITEALRTVYKLVSKTSLNEEESVEVPEDAEAKLEVEEDKIIITIDVEQAKEEVTEEEAEELQEAIDIIRYFLIK